MTDITVQEIKDFVINAGSDDVYTFGGAFEGGANSQQVPDEIAPCIKAVIDSGRKIEAYLEIGAAAGGTAYLFHHFMGSEKIVLLDTNEHPKCQFRPQVLAGIGYQEIIGRSDAPEAIEAAQKAGPYDLIFIDAEHQYSGVKHDAVTYLPFLKTGGFLIFHDTAAPDWGVIRVVEELKRDPSMEFIGEWKTTEHHRPCGVALFRKVGA